MTGTTLRGARPVDVPSMRAIDAANEGADAPPVLKPDALDGYYRFLIEHGRSIVATVDDHVVAFGSVISSGRLWHLADLFVLPEWHGRGIGQRLLAELFEDRWPRTTFSSDDERAMPIYIRAGMRPLWPNLLVTGDARRLPELPTDLSVDPSTADEVAALEREWLGIDRPETHAFWARQPDARSIVVRLDGVPVAAGHSRSRYRGQGRMLDVLFVAPSADPIPPILAALRAAAADPEGGIATSVPGPNPVVPFLIEAGFRIVDKDTFMTSDPSLVDPARLLPNPGIL